MKSGNSAIVLAVSLALMLLVCGCNAPMGVRGVLMLRHLLLHLRPQLTFRRQHWACARAQVRPLLLLSRLPGRFARARPAEPSAMQVFIRLPARTVPTM